MTAFSVLRRLAFGGELIAKTLFDAVDEAPVTVRIDERIRSAGIVEQPSCLRRAAVVPAMRAEEDVARQRLQCFEGVREVPRDVRVRRHATDFRPGVDRGAA